MKTIYHYSVQNLSGETLGTRIDLDKVVAIDEPRPREVQFDVHIAGLRSPVKLFYMTEAAYQALINAWERHNTNMHTTQVYDALRTKGGTMNDDDATYCRPYARIVS